MRSDQFSGLAMKSVCRLSILLAAAAFFSVGCEPHTFDETSILHQDHGGHGEGHGDGHGDEHHGDHGDKHHGKSDEKHTDDADHGHDDAAKKKKAAPAAAKEEPREVGI